MSALPIDALDPSSRDALEEQREFLLRSLDDLEREYAAGDVDDVDYAALRDDYTARAAAVIRSLEQPRAAVAAEARPRAWGRTIRALAVVGVFAAVAGVLIARASGSRQAGDFSTGDIARNTRQLLADAQSAAAAGDFAKSIAIYTKALDAQPSNVEALTYRGWSQERAGDTAAAWRDLNEAVDRDPRYPDARVFRAVLFIGDKRYDEAAADLAVFDTLGPPQIMRDLVASQGVREKIVEGKLLVADPPTLAASGLRADDVRSAAERVAEEARLSDALKLFDIVLAADPGDVRARAYKGWVLARAGVQAKQQQLVDVAVSEFDRALAIDPAYPDALVFRSFTRFYGLNRAADAKADLAAFDALADRPESLVKLVDENGLRAAIDEKLNAG